MSLLSVELVPATCWYTNVRSNVSRRDWERCKDFVKARSGGRCEVCGGRGSRYPVDCHEIWEYDDERQIQTLVGLIALCPACHEVKHLGRAMQVGNGDRAVAHLMKVNGWNEDAAERYCMLVFRIWEMRSQYEWELDISFLNTLGINSSVADRPVR